MWQRVRWPRRCALPPAPASAASAAVCCRPAVDASYVALFGVLRPPIGAARARSPVQALPLFCRKKKRANFELHKTIVIVCG